MLESDHEIEDDSAPTTETKQEVASDDKVVIDPLEQPADADASNTTLKERAKKVAADVQAGAKVTYARVKEKTEQYRKELGERTSKVLGATTEATLDAVGKALFMAENSKTYIKSVLTKEALQKMRENAMKKYPQYFTGDADKNREAFQDFLAQGAEPVHIEAGKQTQLPFRVKNGDVVRWNFRVLNNDVEFSVNIRKMEVGGAVEENVRQPQRFKAGSNHQGSYSFVYASGQVVLTWSNAYSWMKGKHIAYIAEVVSAEAASKLQTTGHVEAASEAASSDSAAAATTAPAADEISNKTEAPPIVMQEPEADDASQSEQQELPAVAATTLD